MVIVDTTVLIDYLRGTQNPHTQWVDREVQRQRFGITDLILCEVLQGIHDQGEFEQVRKDLSTLQVFNTGGSDMAIAAAQNYRVLRRRGYTIHKTIDCLVATFCLKSRFQLLHRDRDYDAFEGLGLEVIHP
jgi:predicted nucleic acid-binding protein